MKIKQLEQEILLNFKLDQFSNLDLVQIIELSVSLLNLKTITDFAKEINTKKTNYMLVF